MAIFTIALSPATSRWRAASFGAIQSGVQAATESPIATAKNHSGVANHRGRKGVANSIAIIRIDDVSQRAT